MTGLFWLDWAILATSLFNTLVLMWLGATVLLNAERRTWGIWLAGGGLLAGAAFFVSHTAILGHGPYATTGGMEFWWRIGWAPLLAAPFAWYVLMLWYAGGWEHGWLPTPAYRKPFALTTALIVVLAGLFLFANPFPSYYRVIRLQLAPAPAVGGIPLLVLGYVVYIVLCISLSLHVLRRPAPPSRVMGDLARQRARPWLMAASTSLLAVSLLMTWTILWIIAHSGQNTQVGLQPDLVMVLGWTDLAASALIAVSVVLLGQAIIAYEVFTGKSLPRRGFRRHWRSAVILAAGYAALVSWSLTIQLRPAYGLLLTAMVMIAFYALLVRRSFAEREQTIQQLRPFVSSQQLYDRLVTGVDRSHAGRDVSEPLHALCSQVLQTDRGCLVAMGPMAPLMAPVWTNPPAAQEPLDWLADVAVRATSHNVTSLPLDPAHCSRFSRVVPLWGAHGLIGVLLVGDKRDGGPYTQEEIEIARAAGERLIDTQASAELAHRLMALQRQRLTESQLLDQRARCALHDDILPRLHATMLALSAVPRDRERPQLHDAVTSLAEIHQRLSELLRNLPAPGDQQLTRLGLMGALRQAVEDEMAEAFAAVSWQVETDAEAVTRRLNPLIAQVVFYAAREALRNAARHAHDLSDRPLCARVSVTWQHGLMLRIEDDGVGLPATAAAGSGPGHGLALHSTLMTVIGGTLTVESAPGTGTRVVLHLPQSAIGEGLTSDPVAIGG